MEEAREGEKREHRRDAESAENAELLRGKKEG
jgi:hypothetical protein